MTNTPGRLVKLSFIFPFLLIWATSIACAQPSDVVTPPEVRILTYTNSNYHYHDGQQDWIYSPTETRHGGGYLRTHNMSTFHRFTGGTHTNFFGNHSYATGYPFIYEWYVETRGTTDWAGPLPATASLWNYYTNTYWFDGMTGFIPDEGSSSSTDTNFTWEPSEARKLFSSENVPGWTFIFTWGEPHQGYFEKWTNNTKVDTTLELSAGVYPDPIHDTAIMLNVWAYDNLRQRYLTRNEFTVGGRAPDLNDNLFYRIKDNQRTNLNFDFFPTNALPTNALPGSHDYSFWAHPQWVHFSIAVDRNSDEQIEHYWTNDLTTVDLPYLFWANNDRDFFQAHSGPGPSYFEYDDIQATPGGATDYGFAYIHNERDLEDFSPMQLFVPTVFTTTNWGMRISGGKVKLFAREDGTRSYLVDPLTATALTGTNGTAYLGDTGDGPVFIPSSQFNGSSTLNLLFEAGETGKFSLNAELMLGGDVLCTNRVWLKILDVKSMYDQWVVADLDTDWPSVDYVPPTAAFKTDVDSEVLAQLTGSTNYVLFVHGWNMKQWAKEAFASTAFKRLWWQGYRGRFGAFRWPTYNLGGGNVFSILSNYDCSEYNSWRSAHALTNVLVQLNAPNLCQGNVAVMAHSMGNVVTGEALRLLGTNTVPGTDTKYVKTYIAMQGAIPTHCYDRDDHFSPFTFGDSGTWNPYSYYWDLQATNYMADLKGAETYWNLCNSKDYALKNWLIDQYLKPDGTLSYFWSTSRFPSSGFYRVQSGWTYDLNFPNDTHQIFAFGSEPRSFALGASTNVNGFFAGNEFNLQTALSFDETHDFHSKQFRSTIQLQFGFWDGVLTRFGFIP